MEDGWTAEPGVGEPADSIAFGDFGFLDDVTHPVRGLLIRRLAKPRTVAQIATAMDVPVTRLYHHIKQLADRGLIRVVATRRVGSALESQYQVTAKSFQLDPAFLESSDATEVAAAIGSVFDAAKLDMQRQIEEHGLQPDDEDSAVVSLGEVMITRERHAEIVRQLRDVIDEVNSTEEDNDPDAVRLSLFIAAFPNS